MQGAPTLFRDKLDGLRSFAVKFHRALFDCARRHSAAFIGFGSFQAYTTLFLPAGSME